MPENTLAGFEYAIRHGVDAVEMDLVTTEEGEVVISHDPLRHRGDAPTLDDVFHLASLGEFQYDLEIKTWSAPLPCPEPSTFVRLVLDEICRYGLERRVSVLSFDFHVLAAMREAAPEIRLSALTENDTRDFREISAEAAGAEIVSPQFDLVTSQKVQAAHAAGIQIVPWTVNTAADWDWLIAANVDGIVTDDPVGLLAHLRGPIAQGRGSDSGPR
jgi:glycerophosphoryl diester phosphodiesterase